MPAELSPIARASRDAAVRRWAGLALLVPLALAGCSGSGGNDAPAPDPTASGVASSTSAPTLPAGVSPAPIPTKVANNPTARQSVVMTACAAAKGGWGASGTATNTTKAAVTYDVTVFFTTTAATTVNYASTKVAVKPGETVKWAAEKSFSAPKEMLCVLRGVSAT